MLDDIKDWFMDMFDDSSLPISIILWLVIVLIIWKGMVFGSDMPYLWVYKIIMSIVMLPLIIVIVKKMSD